MPGGDPDPIDPENRSLQFVYPERITPFHDVEAAIEEAMRPLRIPFKQFGVPEEEITCEIRPIDVEDWYDLADGQRVIPNETPNWSIETLTK